MNEETQAAAILRAAARVVDADMKLTAACDKPVVASGLGNRRSAVVMAREDAREQAIKELCRVFGVNQ